MPPVKQAPQPKKLDAFPEPTKKAVVNSKTPKPVKKAQPRPVEQVREVAYPNCEVRIYSNPPEGITGHPLVGELLTLLTDMGLQPPSDFSEQANAFLTRKNMGYLGPMTCEIMKKLLGWETEAQYTKRMMSANPGAAEESCKFEVKSEGRTTRIVDYTLVDANGEKVMCWNNLRNRPLDEATYSKYGQDILNKGWEFNLETFIVSTTGNVVSGQHRGIGFVLACQMWARKDERGKHWREVWPEEPTIDMLVAFGFVENAKTLRTLDNVRPRTEADVFYTSEFFIKQPNAAKKEMSRMLQVATDMLWKRTRAGNDSFTHYQTHSTSVDFVERHKRLLKCVEYLYDANSSEGRAISVLKLSAGECSAMMYLMGSSKTDGDTYHKPAEAADRSEKKCDWTYWDRACEFWTLLAGKSGTMKPVVDALGMIRDPMKGEGGSKDEQHAVIAKAWGQFLTDEGITDIALNYIPEYNSDKTQVVGQTLQDWPEFGGIDKGPSRKKVDEGAEEAAAGPTVSPEEVRKQRAAELADILAKRRAEKGVSQTVAASGSGTPGQPGKPPAPALKTLPVPKGSGPQKLDSFPGQTETPIQRQLRVFRTLETENPDNLLIFKGGKGYFAWDKHCHKVCEVLGCDPLLTDGQLPKVNISEADWEEALERILKHGEVVSLVEKGADGDPGVTQTIRNKETVVKPAAAPATVVKPPQPKMKPVPVQPSVPVPAAK
jgi:hypothetical protein